MKIERFYGFYAIFVLIDNSVFEEKSKIYAELQTIKYFELGGIIA
jgi:hypothetical protein